MKKRNAIMLVSILFFFTIIVTSCQKEVEQIEGALPGLFSVSDNQKVRFSQGNLQYQVSTNTWRFAEIQYSYGDLFGWGTGDNPTLSSDNYGAYGTFVDWGSNPISNGGNTANRWRTLTPAEWKYLLNTRPGASSKLGMGNINGVGGLIILPDNWTLPPSGCTFICGISSSYNDWTRNSYTLSQWAQMETAGAVFLPAAGYRVGTHVSSVGYNGNYWSSSPYNESCAYYMYFYGSNLTAAFSNGRYYGFSVRPVLDN